MMRWLSRVLAVALAVALGWVDVVPADAQLATETVLDGGVASPMMLAAPDGDDRIFIVERGGAIRIWDADDGLAPSAFLDLGSAVDTGGEGGLLGLAFSPDYATDGFFYVHYTTEGVAQSCPFAECPLETRLSRFRATGDPATSSQADPASEWLVFSHPQPRTNHNGGSIDIRGDFLYLGLGDGGGSGDPLDLAQDDASRLGKLLRFDLSAVPANPQAERVPEVYAKGLRNPFRWSFDRSSGDLYIGDVGQNAIEEIDALAASAPPGANFGWDVEEGSACFDPDSGEPPCGDASLLRPIYEYDQAGGDCFAGGSGSVTGGHVYRGSAIASLAGTYFFADFCTGEIWSLRWTAGGGLAGPPIDRAPELDPGGQYSSPVAISEDGRGELYLVDLGGRIGRIVPEPSQAAAAGAALAGVAALAHGRRAKRRREASRALPRGLS